MLNNGRRTKIQSSAESWEKDLSEYEFKFAQENFHGKFPYLTTVHRRCSSPVPRLSMALRCAASHVLYTSSRSRISDDTSCLLLITIAYSAYLQAEIYSIIHYFFHKFKSTHTKIFHFKTLFKGVFIKTNHFLKKNVDVLYLPVSKWEDGVVRVALRIFDDFQQMLYLLLLML